MFIIDLCEYFLYTKLYLKEETGVLMKLLYNYLLS
jgi:hypothetical protein